ncbi:MAG: T9SS type A sorting domain-containing protein, partial [Agriterribacter sp.]
SVTQGGGSATEVYFKEYKCNTPDTDSDGVVNRLDPDSDNDGCSDALEAGATTDTTANYQFTGTDANGNGLIDIVQKDAGDSINYTSTYKPYAVNNMVNACTDTDGDDVNNIKDLDDDNDGVLDAVEAPGCYYTSAGAAAPLSVSTSTVSTVKSAPVVKGANIPTLHDGVTASASASNHVIAINQSLTGANIYTIAYPTAVSLSAVEVIGGTANWGARTAAALYGSNDSTSWAPLMSAPLNTTTGTTKTFTVNQNAAQYRYYQVRGTAGNSATITNYEVRGILNASTYNASAHPKNTCTTDTDNDGIINTADLDSDGDGCSDAVEAKVAKRSGGPVMQPGGLKNGSNGNVTSEKNTSKAVVSGPYGNNGFANSVETSDESGMYNSTYTYAKATDGSPDIDCATFSEVLPFRLLKFTVRAANESVMLTWKTTNEVNNDYFEVERSADGAAWTVIGRVKAHNRPGVHRYVLRDAGPVKGEAYYRLKQRNFDGTYTYSKVEMVNKTPGVLLKLYPNPAYNYIMVTMAVLRPADITVWNVLGKNVTTRVIIKQMDAGKLNLYIEGLTSGIYIIKAKGKAAAFVKMD